MTLELLQDPLVKDFDKIKLLALYSLRYENDDRIEKLKDLLRQKGISQESLNMINYLLEYAGVAKRSGDLFSNKDMLGEAKQLWKKTFKNVPNIYTQHQPYILNIIDQINKGKLKENEYPTSNGPCNFKERY